MNRLPNPQPLLAPKGVRISVDSCELPSGPLAQMAWLCPLPRGAVQVTTTCRWLKRWTVSSAELSDGQNHCSPSLLERRPTSDRVGEGAALPSIAVPQLKPSSRKSRPRAGFLPARAGLLEAKPAGPSMQRSGWWTPTPESRGSGQWIDICRSLEYGPVLVGVNRQSAAISAAPHCRLLIPCHLRRVATAGQGQTTLRIQRRRVLNGS